MITKHNWWMWWTVVYLIAGFIGVFGYELKQAGVLVLQLIWMIPLVVWIIWFKFFEKEKS